MLLIVLFATLTFAAIPQGRAQEFTLTINDCFCKLPGCMTSFECTIWFGGGGDANDHQTSYGPITLDKDHPYEFRVLSTVTCPTCGEEVHHERYDLTRSPMDSGIDIRCQGAAKAVSDGVVYNVIKYQITVPAAGPNAVAINANYNRAGAAIDRYRAKIVKNPDAQLIAMQVEDGVVLTDLIRTGDIEKLDTDGFTITSSAGFHMGHIGFNIRADRDYLNTSMQAQCTPEAAPVLSDVWFRKACMHLYNQEEIVSSIYGYTVTPVQSLVAPAQGGWRNKEVEKPPYNPGDPLDTTEYDPVSGEYADACSTLRYAGYTYHPGRNNWITPYDIDNDTIAGETNGDDDIPRIMLWTPTYEVAPTSAEHGARFIDDCHAVGLSSMVHDPREFNPYMDLVDVGAMDMYMVFWSLGRFPDQLYTMCHSDHDVAKVPADYNKPGCHDDYLDELVFTLISSLNHQEKLAACYEAQRVLYNETYPDCAFAYMQLYSRIYFNGFNPDLRGIVNSPGYGSHNGWTELNMRWAEGAERLEGGETIIEWLWGEEPELLNPCSASSVYAWDIIDLTLDGCISVNPYTHEDMPWMAEDWNITSWPGQGAGNDETWMNVTFQLRKDIFWQDGRLWNATDVAFNWLFLRDNQIPRYMGMWMFLQDVDIINPYRVRAIMNITSQFLLYDLAGTAALLPPPVWEPLDGAPLEDIMQYDAANEHGTLPGMGPWFNPTSGLNNDPGYPETHLYGTGIFVFESYSPTLLAADLRRSVTYFRNAESIAEQKTSIFHVIGDVTYDGYIDVFDLSSVGAAYGRREGQVGYNPDADLNVDKRVDAKDLAFVTFYYGEQKEYPEP